jgi:hypothetical protein
MLDVFLFLEIEHRTFNIEHPTLKKERLTLTLSRREREPEDLLDADFFEPVGFEIAQGDGDEKD